jgi:hypothetical protein
LAVTGDVGTVKLLATSEKGRAKSWLCGMKKSRTKMIFTWGALARREFARKSLGKFRAKR